MSEYKFKKIFVIEINLNMAILRVIKCAEPIQKITQLMYKGGKYHNLRLINICKS